MRGSPPRKPADKCMLWFLPYLQVNLFYRSQPNRQPWPHGHNYVSTGIWAPAGVPVTITVGSNVPVNRSIAVVVSAQAAAVGVGTRDACCGQYSYAGTLCGADRGARERDYPPRGPGRGRRGTAGVPTGSFLCSTETPASTRSNLDPLRAIRLAHSPMSCSAKTSGAANRLGHRSWWSSRLTPGVRCEWQAQW